MSEAVKSPEGMGLVSSTSLVIGNMIGSGVFLLPAALAGYGKLALVGWALSASGSLVLAIMFARLSSVLPAAGGPYAYTRIAFGDFAGYLAAWCYWKAAWIGNAAISLSLIGYLSVFFHPLAKSSTAVLLAIVLVWVCTFINIRGFKLFNRLNVPLTFLKLIPLMAIGIFGWWYFHPANLAMPHWGVSIPETNPIAAIATAATLTMWSFIGLESATVPADHVRNPKWTIPRATLIGTALTGAIYVLSVTAVQGIVPTAQLMRSAAPFADAARIMVGAWGSYAVAGGAVIATFGALCGWVLMQGQIPMAAARDGLFPDCLAKLNNKDVPVISLMISSLLVSLLLLTEAKGSFAQIFTIIILVGTMTTLVPYALCAAAILQLLVDKPGLFGVKSAGFMVAIGISGFTYTVWELYGAGEAAVFWGFLVTIAGIPFFTWRQWRNSVRTQPLNAPD